MAESFNLGLNAEQEERANKLHFGNVVIDMLFQGPIGTYSFPDGYEEELEKLAKDKNLDSRMERLEFMGEHIRRQFIDGDLSELYKDCW